MPSATIIIPVHNRRDLTRGCLRRLRADGVLAWAEALVIDDGSTDGTGEMVRLEFPEVTVLRGDGNLWWTGAIALGMRHALERGAEYLFWLNDDCDFLPDAPARLLAIASTRQAMVGGTCVIPGSRLVVYGGLRRRGKAFDLVPYREGAVEACDALSGNLVCLPATLARSIGLPDARRFPQAIGDLDYGLRANAAGWPVLVAHDALAEAVPNDWDNHASWLLSDLPVVEIWRSAWRKRSYGYFPTQWRFFTRHWGLAGGLHALWLLGKRLPIIAVRLAVPRSWLRRWWGARSRAWQEERRLRAALSSPSAREKPPG